MSAWVLLIVRMQLCCEAFPMMLLGGYVKVGKTLFVDFWVILRSGNSICNCVVYPFDLNNLWGIFL